MKYYITNYWQTAGIIEVEGEITESGLLTCKIDKQSYPQSFNRNQFSKTKQGAVIQCENLRAKKIASFKASIAKIEKIKF